MEFEGTGLPIYLCTSSKQGFFSSRNVVWGGGGDCFCGEKNIQKTNKFAIVWGGGGGGGRNLKLRGEALKKSSGGK